MKRLTGVFTLKVRMYFYGIVLAGLALSGAYGIIDPSRLPLWIALGAAALATGTATAYSNQQLKNGHPLGDPADWELTDAEAEVIAQRIKGLTEFHRQEGI